MVKRYHAPYIFKKFTPHFTLLSNVNKGDQLRLVGELQAMFDAQVDNRTIRVDRLAVMSQPAPGQPWVIEREIRLKS